MAESVADIRVMADTGVVCSVIGHKWREYDPGLDSGVNKFLDAGHQVHSGRVCMICKKRQVTVWKDIDQV
jgi:hypothetical protein